MHVRRRVVHGLRVITLQEACSLAVDHREGPVVAAAVLDAHLAAGGKVRAEFILEVAAAQALVVLVGTPLAAVVGPVDNGAPTCSSDEVSVSI